jgi:hypothetical protein
VKGDGIDPVVPWWSSGIKFTPTSYMLHRLSRLFSPCFRIILERAMDIPKNGESSTSPAHRSASSPRHQAGANGMTGLEMAEGGSHPVEKSRLILPAWDGELHVCSSAALSHDPALTSCRYESKMR